MWDEPSFAYALNRLASVGRLICLDYRGSGASDNIPLGTTPTAESWMEDIRAVLETVGSERATLIVNVPSGFMALLFAATYPEQTQGLVLINSSACWLKDEDYPFGGTEDDLASLWSLPKSDGATVRSPTSTPPAESATLASDNGRDATSASHGVPAWSLR
jgi:pimeloyl-ACP methyl ester carboxylesterase